jgi:uncharacterized phage protein (TIGR01671 family)
MAREIKFRFWTGKSMIYSDSYISLYYFFQIISNVILQQFSGLKDKNGVEIYEGDIVAGYGYNTKTGEHIPPEKGFEVVFKNGCFEWRNEVLGWDMSEGEIPAPYDTQKWALVIGNIHEHQELIKK